MPKSLPPKPQVLWEVPLAKSALGGIAATEDVVVFGDRDFEDFHDVYRCLDAKTGELLWEVQQLSINSLDYGNSPRATPLIEGQRVFLFGASGDLLCVDLTDGNVIWNMNVRSRFGDPGELPWGFCGSPLMAGGKLIVNPGSTDASIVALDPADGSVLWQTPGRGPSYGSLQAGTFGGQQQIVGHDATTIGGWSVRTGERLWTIEPEFGGDFNVPTPVKFEDQLLITTENNGTRLFAFQEDGTIAPKPVAVNKQLKPNMSSPVRVGSLLFCVDKFLYCLDIEDNLEERWRLRDRAFGDYASIIASEERLLVVGNGEILLLPSSGEKQILSRQTIFDDGATIYSHPALVGDRLYVRGENDLQALRLSTDSQ